MNIHDKSTRVSLKIRYNGYIHNCIGLNTSENGETNISVFGDQIPLGYTAEHEIHQICFERIQTELQKDLSGEHGWILEEILDLDQDHDLRE